MEILQKNQMSYIFDELHHPVIKGKIGVKFHIKERLFERQRLSIKDLGPYFQKIINLYIFISSEKKNRYKFGLLF